MTVTHFRTSVQSPAKLNLSLRIVGIRPDGYHLLDSSMVPISLFDRLILTFIPGNKIHVRCHASEASVPQGGENIAARAAELFLRRTGQTGTVSIEIDKQIPMGAGLGGGSSDAAAVLRMMACGFGKPEPELLAEWAVDLGADVPFFVHGYPARVEGIGERVSAEKAPINGPLVVAFPGVHLATAAVYQAYDDSLTRSADLSSGSLFASEQGSSRGVLVNDLEAAAMRLYPPLRSLKMRILELGALGALMTGSGSAVFGIWQDSRGADEAATTLRAHDGIWAQRVEIIEQVLPVQRHTSQGEELIDGR